MLLFTFKQHLENMDNIQKQVHSYLSIHSAIDTYSILIDRSLATPLGIPFFNF